MKMVKSLLLGSAAGIVAAAGAQAADLPVKAKAVEYVKVCSLYGAGFYYIPGTDTCIKLGGFVRFDTDINGDLSGATTFINGGDALFNRAQTRYYEWRSRFMLSTDVRSQTEYGTLRAYMRAGWQYTTGSASVGTQGDNSGSTVSGDNAGRPKDGVVYTERAFIQFAGFTFGKTQSFFDLWSAAAVANANLWGYDDTGNGEQLAAYTAMLGNGVSASIAIEDPSIYRRGNIYQTGSGLFSFGGLNSYQTNPFGQVSYSNAANSYGGTRIPDIVGTLRIDQAWGSAQVGGLVHEVRPAFNSTTLGNGRGSAAGGGPSVKYGWAVMGGVDLNLPWAKGDRFIGQVTYTEGVPQTAMGGINNTSIGIAKGGKAALGYIIDATWATGPGASLQLTTAWAAIAGIEHYWTPTLRSSLFGDYVAIRYNGSTATTGSGFSNMCVGMAAVVSGTCNPNLNLWQVGTRTVWTPVPNLDIGLESVYSRVDQNNSGSTTPGGATSGTYTLADRSTWNFAVRVQRSFWP